MSGSPPAPEENMPNEVPASPPAPEENMPNEVPAPVLKWTQGATEGTCEVTNACGLHDALRAGGAVLSDELEVIVRKGKFAKTSLLALLCQPEKASPRAPLLDATCWIELAVPVDLPAVCMHITKGEVTDTMSVVKPVTAETVANALICKGHITKEDSDQNSVELVFGSVSIELKAVMDDAEARKTELCSIFADVCESPPVLAAEIQVKVLVGDGGSLKSQLLEKGWPFVFATCKRLQADKGWSQSVLASNLGVSPTLISQLFSGKYVGARAKSQGGLMKPADAESWSKHFARAESAATGTAGALAADAVKRREPKFNFKANKMGDEPVEKYLERACESRIESGGRRDNAFIESVVGRVNGTLTSSTHEVKVLLDKRKLVTWCDSHGYKAARFHSDPAAADDPVQPSPDSPPGAP